MSSAILRTLPVVIGVVASGAAITIGAIASASAQQTPLHTAPAGDTSTVTKAPSTPLITFASPTLKAPPYGQK